MKKFTAIICFLLLVNAAHGVASIPESTPAQKNPNYFNPNSLFNVQQSIDAKQQTIRDKYKNYNQTPITTTPQNQKTPENSSSGQKTEKRHYIPRVYSIEYVKKEEPKKQEPKQEIIINNTYNYYNTSSNTTSNNNKQTELTQKQKDEAEKQELKKKYSSILSNKTMENSKMCSLMAAEFPNASKDELDRVLNKILYLNCNISKLR